MTNNVYYWQNLQIAMNNFRINNLMSYTNIIMKLAKALASTDKDTKDYQTAIKIKSMINDLNHQNDFILNTKHNQQLFFKIQDHVIKIIGRVVYEDPLIDQINHIFNELKQQKPKLAKQFNAKAHQNHMSMQQAMFKYFEKKCCDV